MFAISFSTITISLLGVMLLAGIIALMLVVPRLKSVVRKIKEDDEASEEPIAATLPPVSVIVHAQSDASVLDTLIPMIMAQNYPADFEVIVVNDGCDEAVTDNVALLEAEYRNLYMTFAPGRSRNLSRKKLSVTLGVKAARYDTVVILAGNTILRSDRWLAQMMRHIVAGKEIVVGYGYVIPAHDAPAERRRLMAFDTVRTAVEYLGSALSGRLYRSFPTNIAYTRQLFFDNKGFSGALNLRYGDDDIFINSIAGRRNFAVELSQDSMVKIVEENPAGIHRLDKLRHDFTSRMVYRGELRRWGLASTCWWLAGLAAVGASLSGLPSLVPAIASLVVMTVMSVVLMVSWRRASSALNSRRLLLTVPWLMWIHPFYTLVYRMMGHRRRKENYTWYEVH